jgi:hypothetical protein
LQADKLPNVIDKIRKELNVDESDSF